MPKSEKTFTFKPAASENWEDMQQLFGPRGATGGCWCMYWRLKHAEYEGGKGEGNRKAMADIIRSKEVPGILAYDRDQAIGWCSVAPRLDFVRLERSRILKPFDDQPVWSVVCFFVHKDYRQQGVSGALLGAAVDYAASQGAEIIEGYPIEPRADHTPAVFAWVGFAETFRRAGFKEVARRSETRPFMRYSVGR